MNRVTIGILVASVALNLAFAGFLIGRENAPPPTFDPTRSFVAWSQNLDAERATELRRVMRAHAGDHRRHLRSLRGQNRALKETLRATDLDRSELAEILKEMREAHLLAQEQSHGAFLTFVASLSHEERISLAADMRKHRIRGPLGKPRFRPRNGVSNPLNDAPNGRPRPSEQLNQRLE